MADRFCVTCGTSRLDGATFCTHCGHRFDASSAAPAPAQAGYPPAPAPPAHPVPAPTVELSSGLTTEPGRYLPGVPAAGPLPPPGQGTSPFGAGSPEPLPWPQGAHVPPSGAQPAGGPPPGVVWGLPLRELLPTRYVRALDWRSLPSALFALAAAAPFALLQIVANDTDLHRAAVGFAVYFALLWAVALYVLIAPGRLPWSLLAKVGAFTLVAGVSVAIAVEKTLDAGTSSLLRSIFTVGLPEEVAKAAAVFLFCSLGSTVWPLRTYLFVGALSGLVFGAAEAVGYTQLYGQILQVTGGDPSAVVVTLWRLLSNGLFHGCMAGITALFLGLARRNRTVGTQLAILGVALAAVLHGLYDWSAGGWGGTLIAIATIVIFLAYVRGVDQIEVVSYPQGPTGAATGRPGGPLGAGQGAVPAPGPAPWPGTGQLGG